jgi:hypothetical protein
VLYICGYDRCKDSGEYGTLILETGINVWNNPDPDRGGVHHQLAHQDQLVIVQTQQVHDGPGGLWFELEGGGWINDLWLTQELCTEENLPQHALDGCLGGPTSTSQPTQPPPAPTQEIEGLVREGTHLVGTGIEPGIYVGLAGGSLLNSCYWARLSNLTGSDDILSNENAIGLYYVEVLPSDKALETACDLLPIEQVPARDEFLTVLPPGMYLVGRDIEAGTYRGEAGDDLLESCYWSRLSNVSGDDNILANDNSTGQYYIQVLPTDFALTVACEVEKVE